MGNIENAEKISRKFKNFFCRELQGDLKQGQREEEEKKKGKLLLMVIVFFLYLYITTFLW